MIKLILGGTRSGKSRYAEQLAIDSNKEKYYIATAQADDKEMTARIKQHQKRRGANWTTILTPYTLSNTLRNNDAPNHYLLVDCLTLWLSNLLHSSKDNDWKNEKQMLLQTLPTLQADITLVSNEVGLGVVPMGELTREFIDELGYLHQELAQISQCVTLVIAGLPLKIK